MHRKALSIRFVLATFAAVMLSLSDAAGAADEIKARGTLVSAKGPYTVELLIDKRDRATLRVTPMGQSKVERTALVTNAEVVPLLIDRRLSFLWPALADWAGPSLERLRARMLADSEAAFARGKRAYGDAVAAGIGDKAGAYYERAVVLQRAGQAEQAIALLQKATDEWTPGKPWGRTEQSILIVVRAGMLAERGRFNEADRALVAAPERLGTGSHLLNIMATHAMFLAITGKYSQALSIVDATAAAYTAYAKSIGGMLSTVPGTDRYFAAIRGCALTGLGRTDEARTALAPTLGIREPGSLLLKVPETNSDIRLRTYACLRDRPGYAREIVANVAGAPIGSAALTLMQPAFKTPLIDPALLETTRADPHVVSALAEIVRPLPPELVPALNDWSG